MAKRRKGQVGPIGQVGQVGIVGLGIMGGAFAGHLCRAGWDVSGYDIKPERCRALARTGVSIVSDAAEVAARASVILTSLPDPDALHMTVAAICKAKLPRRILADMSTFTLEDKQRAEAALCAAGHVMLDCPVSGTGAQAKARDAIVYASGNGAALRKARPALAAVARAVHEIGAFGNGSRMKYVANLLVAIHNVASAEAMVLGMKAGLKPEHIVKMVSAGAGNSRIFELRAPMMAKDSYDPATMKISVWRKDMHVIDEFARSIGVATPVFDATRPLYQQAIADGLGEQDTAAVCRVLEARAGMKRRKMR